MRKHAELLFVYGTLRPALAREARPLVDGMEHVGPATIRGELYDLGRYPGMIPGNDVVHGDLLRVRDPASFDALDAYEECGGATPLFHRVLALAQDGNGMQVLVWTYLYARPMHQAIRIPGGDYAAHQGLAR